MSNHLIIDPWKKNEIIVPIPTAQIACEITVVITIILSGTRKCIICALVASPCKNINLIVCMKSSLGCKTMLARWYNDVANDINPIPRISKTMRIKSNWCCKFNPSKQLVKYWTKMLNGVIHNKSN